jgi:uncharacterized membrane protein YgaE (UPF0421/DUF939 family)
MLIVSCAAYALLLAILMAKWTNTLTITEGGILGATVGVLIAIMTNSYWFSTTHFFNDIKPVMVDVLAAGLTVGVMGSAIGWFLGFWEAKMN